MTGEELKQHGMALVLSHAGTDWKDQVIAASTLFLIHNQHTTGPELRAFCIGCGCAEPAHVNAWGAAINRLAHSGAMESTKNFIRSTEPKAHSRFVMIWRSRIYGEI